MITSLATKDSTRYSTFNDVMQNDKKMLTVGMNMVKGIKMNT